MKTKRVPRDGIDQIAGLSCEISALKVFLTTLCISCIVSSLLSVTYIRVGNNEQFTDLQPAITHALTALGDETAAQIDIMYNTLPSSPGYVIDIGSSNLDHLIIIGMGANNRTSISYEGTASTWSTFAVNGNTNDDKEVTLQQLSITGVGSLVILEGIKINGGLHRLRVVNCEFSSLGMGIYIPINYTIDNTVRYIEIDSCLFTEPSGIGSGLNFKPYSLFYNGINSSVTSVYSIINSEISGYSDSMGEISIMNDYGCDTLLVFFENNLVNLESNNPDPRLAVTSNVNCSVIHGINVLNNRIINGWVDIQGVSGAVENNIFFAQSERNLIQQLSISSGGINNGFGVSIKNNTFSGTAVKAISHIYRSSFGTMTATIINNTFLNSGIALAITTGQGYLNGNDAVPLLYNNLIACGGVPFSCNLTFNPPIEVSYSFFLSTFPNNVSFSIDTGTCLAGDPLISMDTVNHTYKPIWNSLVRSPCINSGCPELNGIPQTDPDGTPTDIGAVYYTHHHQEYVFDRVPSHGIHWLSFPVLDDKSHTGTQHWNEIGYLFRDHMLYPANQIETASWSYYGNSGVMDYFNSDWRNSNYLATQPKGFKLKFSDNVVPISPVLVDGFKTDAATIPVELYRGNNNDFDNWIGYFITYTQGAGDAFSKLLPESTRETYLDHIWVIKAQTWCTCRIDHAYDSPWIVDPNTYTLSEGDMVSVLLLHYAPREMYWATFSQSQTPRTRGKAENFSYTEELDYTPIFIEFDPDNLPDEVGLMVAGECKGAAVVDNTLIEVNYYGTSTAKGNDEIEIMFYYGDKGRKKAPAASVYNPQTMLFEAGSLKANQLGEYGYVSFNRDAGSSLVPLITELRQNYPNLFKGSTNISWVQAKDEPISIDIYNLKGQKVTTIFDGPGKKGRQVLSWDARDFSGQNVASGVYFYRLSSSEGSKVRKMMVVK